MFGIQMVLFSNGWDQLQDYSNIPVMHMCQELITYTGLTYFCTVINILNFLVQHSDAQFLDLELNIGLVNLQYLEKSRFWVSSVQVTTVSLD